MKQEIRIEAHGLPGEEYRKLPYLLKWVWVEGTESLRIAAGDELVDVLLVNHDPGAEPKGPKVGRQDGARQIPVAKDPAHLPKGVEGLTYPLRVVDLQRCLEAVLAESSGQGARSDKPGTQGKALSPEGGTANAAGNPEPGPAASNVDHLLEALLKPDAMGDLRLEGAEGWEITVSPQFGFKSTLGPQEIARLGIDLSGARWTEVGPGKDEDGTGWQPLNRLIWLLAFYGARDGLLPRIPRDRAFTLQAWPDYSVIPMEANNLKVWAYLKSNTADADTIAAATGVDRGQVLGSLNAGYLCGQVAVREAAAAIPKDTENSKAQGILGMIRQRLGLPSANSQECAT